VLDAQHTDWISCSISIPFIPWSAPTYTLSFLTTGLFVRLSTVKCLSIPLPFYSPTARQTFERHPVSRLENKHFTFNTIPNHLPISLAYADLGGWSPPKFYQIRFLINCSRHRNVHWGDFLDSFQINHFFHRDRDENIKCKAYFAEFGQSKCVYCISQKMKLVISFYTKNMVPMSHKLHVSKLLFHLGKIGLLEDKGWISSRL